MGKTKDFEARLNSLEKLIQNQSVLIENLARVQSKIEAVDKPAPGTPIEIFRYVRKRDGYFYDNTNAVTLSFKIDFTTRKISMGWAICVNENFDKEEGRIRAVNRRINSPIIVDYPEEGINNLGIVGLFAIKLGIHKFEVRSFNAWRDVLRKLN